MPSARAAFRQGLRAGRAVANGVKMGRKPKLTPHQKREAIRRRDKGEDVISIAWMQLGACRGANDGATSQE